MDFQCCRILLETKLKDSNIKEKTPLKKNQGVLALILAPTRELALQVHKNIQDVAKTVKIKASIGLYTRSWYRALSDRKCRHWAGCLKINPWLTFWSDSCDVWDSCYDPSFTIQHAYQLQVSEVNYEYHILVLIYTYFQWLNSSYGR